MSWFSTTSHPDIETIDGSLSVPENKSFIVATANLLQKMDELVTPSTLSHVLNKLEMNRIDWSTVSAYQPQLMLTKVGDNGWPDSSTSIVKFRLMSQEVGGYIDHYCMVADHRTKSVVDSSDGTIKSASDYGEPLAWASYYYSEDNDEVIQNEVVAPAAEPKSKTSIVLKPGDSVYSVSKRFKIELDDLLKFNYINDPKAVQVGDRLYIPGDIEEVDDVKYQLFDEPRLMHVDKDGGVQKWSFGNVKKFSDLKKTGQFYANHSTLTILGVAYVPVEDDMTAYYLDGVSLGDFKTTGKVRYMCGFSHADLKNGTYYPPLPTPTPEQPEIVIEPPVDQSQVDEVPEIKSEYEATFIQYEPVKYFTTDPAGLDKRAIDFRNSMPDKFIPKNITVKIDGEFERNRVKYYRLALNRDNAWVGVASDDLIDEEKLYNMDVSLPEKIALRRQLTVSEQGVVYLAKSLSQYTRFKEYLRNKKQKLRRT